MVYTDAISCPEPRQSPTVQVNITNLIDDVQCYQTVRELLARRHQLPIL